MKKLLTLLLHKWNNRNKTYYHIEAVVSTVHNVKTLHSFTLTYMYGKFDPKFFKDHVLKQVFNLHHGTNGVYPKNTDVQSLTINLLK